MIGIYFFNLKDLFYYKKLSIKHYYQYVFSIKTSKLNLIDITFILFFKIIYLIHPICFLIKSIYFIKNHIFILLNFKQFID